MWSGIDKKGHFSHFLSWLAHHENPDNYDEGIDINIEMLMFLMMYNVQQKKTKLIVWNIKYQIYYIKKQK